MYYFCRPNDDRGHDENQWSHVVSHWGVNELRHGDDIPEGFELVVLSPEAGRYVQGTESLVDFVHPENAVYWFGSNHRHLTLDELPRTPDAIVYVPTDSYPEMYNFVCAAVVAYDRRVKGG